MWIKLAISVEYTDDLCGVYWRFMWSTLAIYVEYTDDLCGVNWRFMWSALVIYAEYIDGLCNDAFRASDHIAQRIGLSVNETLEMTKKNPT